MRRGILATGLGFILVLGLTAGVWAQQNVIDNLKIESIRSVQVREDPNSFYLDINVNIANENDRLIRLRNGQFTFYIQSEYNKDKVTNSEVAYQAIDQGTSCNVVIGEKGRIADSKKKIGTAEQPFFVADDCHNNTDEIFLKPGGSNEPNIIMFHVNIGRSHQQAYDALMHMMNCIGYPAIKTPVINIEGKFQLGIKSDKGWSMVESVIIEWVFIPEIQDKVNFMTAGN